MIDTMLGSCFHPIYHHHQTLEQCGQYSMMIDDNPQPHTLDAASYMQVTIFATLMCCKILNLLGPSTSSFSSLVYHL
jgi:hypothetical protein